ncbi:6-hydroxymethylpterin diphosphokinase MptE-like protein [Terasakiella pusilla]|uniref:motility associated factor glycosyltransferase family protein n=1 Tax=Terasakiella pusilla TaxID=64973 RepID=UPI003AA7D5E2
MSLFEKNLEFFKNKENSIYEKVVNFTTENSTLMFEGDTAVNLRMGNVNLYGKNEKDYVDSQMEDFLKNPLRLHFTNPSHCNLSPISIGMLQKLRDRFLIEHKAEFSTFPVTDTGFLYLLGIGLGLIVERLLDEELASNYFLFEPVVEIFAQSMHKMDWEKIYENAENKGINLILIVGETPLQSVLRVEAHIRKIGNTFIDGSYFVAHYSSWEIEEIYGYLMDRLKSFNYSTGFYEDELVMMRNSYENFKNHTFRFIKNGKYLRQEYPVLIVGSGPSLEYDIDIVRELQDRAIVVSCGTTINVLLKNGIVPDFQVEIENVEDVYKFNKNISEKYDLSKIVLIATNTVHPKVTGLFGETWYYARGALSSTRVFMEPNADLEGTTPLSANPAIASMAVLGFRNMYLFGVDCGRYVGASHHHKDSIYHELGMEEQDFDPAYGIRVPGNFGGKVETTAVLDMSRWVISSIRKKFGIHMYNSSHGARIDGAIPMAADAIELESDAGRKALVIKTLRDQLKTYNAGEFIADLDFDKFLEQFTEFGEGFDECMSSLVGKYSSFSEIDSKIEEFWNTNFDKYKCVFAMIGGSFASMIRLAAFYGCRISDEKARFEYIQIFLEAYQEQVLWMVDQSRGLFEDMVNGETVRSFKSYPLPTDEDYVEPDTIGIVEA